MLEQRSLAGGAYAGDLIQHRSLQMAGLLLAVKFNGKAVGLPLYSADHGKQRLILLDSDLSAVCRRQSAGSVAVILHHAIGRDMETHLGHGFHGSSYLSRAAVNEQQVRQVAKLFIAVQIALEAALHHLLHGGVIISMFHVLQFEPAVIPFQGPAIDMDGHRGNNVSASGIGNIKGLNSPGQLLHA